MTNLVGTDKKVVWILGAGFSKPLGLPLATELFSETYGRLAEGFAAPFIYKRSMLRNTLVRDYAEMERFCKPNHISKTLPMHAPNLPAMVARIQSETEAAKQMLERLRGHDERVEEYYDEIVALSSELLAACRKMARAAEDLSDTDARVEARQALERWAKTWTPDKLKNEHWLEGTLDSHRQTLHQALKKIRDVHVNHGMPAEQILVSLDRASLGDPANLRLWAPENSDGAPYHKEESVAATCRKTLLNLTKLIVAELEGPIPETDDYTKVGAAWEPYYKWVTRLVGGNDTIISFNYDRVVEKAFAFAGNDYHLRLSPEDQRPGTRLLKMHGSVTDAQAGPDRIERISVAELHKQVLGFADFRVRLGLPGESKDVGEDTRAKHLLGVWEEAKKAVTEADEFVVLGYSLPPEDVQAMGMIVEAMRERWAEPRKTVCHLVLGPGGTAAALIARTIDQFVQVSSTELYTQNALTSWERPAAEAAVPK